MVIQTVAFATLTVKFNPFIQVVIEIWPLLCGKKWDEVFSSKSPTSENN